jgi:dipeptidyl aminopeptidase/acylaminoacyl peptidase
MRPYKGRWPLDVVQTALCHALACALALVTFSTAHAQAPVPYPRIEAASHTALIWRIAVKRAERWLVTASEDKTARIWNLKTGQLQRILRPPIGAGNEGKLYAVAMSPDGARIALGGFAVAEASGEYPIYLFDRSTGRLFARSRGYGTAANHLTFSPGGRRLAVTFHAGVGLRILDAADPARELAADDGCKADGYGSEFAPDSRAVTSCLEGVVRLFDPQGQRIAQRTLGGDPYGVRFSPDGQRVAVGFGDSTSVQVLILDTCDSGAAAEAARDGASEQKDAIVRLMRSTGRYILAAASPQGKALEDGVNGQGVYTAALLEGLAGKAVPPNATMIDVDALANYVARRVPELTRPKGYEQRPMRTARGENFPLTRRLP